MVANEWACYVNSNINYWTNGAIRTDQLTLIKIKLN
jgi:hypothetical protein